MKTKNTNEFRGEVMTHLNYIKEKVDANFHHLEKVNGRLNKAENNIGKIVAIGTTVFSIIGVAVTLIGIFK
tara:strand:- start:2118 stop:2330 length:213 start_codon:yes stop_codon:yes gene_type:complete